MPTVSIVDPQLVLARRPTTPPPGPDAAGLDADGAPFVAPLFANRLIPLAAALALSLGLWAGIFKLGALLF